MLFHSMRIPAAVVMVIMSAGATAHAEVALEVTPDRTQISEGESVRLQFKASADEQLELSDVKFNAPDFDVVNEHQESFIQSFYENGKFGVRHSQTITKWLRPSRRGTHRIDQIQAKVNGRTYSGQPITVEVLGSNTVSPSNGGSASSGARAGKASAAPRGSVTGFFVRVEVDKPKVFKGEQLIVSYYLYRRSRVFNIQVDKYPVLNGFLREDLDLPVMGTRLDTERVQMDGAVWERSLLAKYAAYPLKEGSLAIDSMSIQANYLRQNAGGSVDDEDDPFTGFFQQLTPLKGTSKSEELKIESLPLPVDGKPAQFSGGIGQFELTATADKYNVRTGDAITVTVRVEGRGNTAAIELPKPQLPLGVDLFDSKGRANAARGGSSSKVFEYVIIPKQPGKIELPPFELSYFDPVKKQYMTAKTPPLSLSAEGSALAPSQLGASPSGAAASGANPQSYPQVGASPGADEIEGVSKETVSRLTKILKWLGIAILAGGLVAGLIFGARRAVAAARAKRQAKLSAPEHLRSQAFKRLQSFVDRSQQLTSDELAQAYDGLCGVIYDALDEAFEIGAKSLSRSELKRVLVQERAVMTEAIWERAAKILEFAEMVRYARSVGAVSDQEAKRQLDQWLKATEQWVSAFKRRE